MLFTSGLQLALVGWSKGVPKEQHQAVPKCDDEKDAEAGAPETHDAATDRYPTFVKLITAAVSIGWRNDGLGFIAGTFIIAINWISKRFTRS